MDRSHWCRAHDPGLDLFKRAFVITPSFTNGDKLGFKLKAKGKGKSLPRNARARRLLDWTQATLAEARGWHRQPWSNLSEAGELCRQELFKPCT